MPGTGISLLFPKIIRNLEHLKSCVHYCTSLTLFHWPEMHMIIQTTSCLFYFQDDERLRNERVRALKAKERFAQSVSGIGSDYVSVNWHTFHVYLFCVMHIILLISVIHLCVFPLIYIYFPLCLAVLLSLEFIFVDLTLLLQLL